MTKPLIIAGATGYGTFIANSLEGTRACLDAPVDGIEIDVQMTADGHVIVYHDYGLSPDSVRLDDQWLSAPGPAFKTQTLAELQAYDIGRMRPGSDYDLRFPDRHAADGVRIATLPTLLAALNTAPGPQRLLYVEIKTDPTDPDMAPDPEWVTNAVLDDLEATDYVAHAKIIAFDWQVLRIADARIPGIATAHLTIPAALVDPAKRSADGRSPWHDGADPCDHGGSELAAIKAHGGMEWSPYFGDVSADRLAEADALGLKVGPWGLSRREDVRRMIDLGVFSATVSGPDWS